MAKKNTSELLDIEVLAEAAECLKVMAHPFRLRMVDILLGGPRPVHEIAALCGLPAHQACEHLRLMKGQGLLGSRRRGRLVFYEVVHPRLPALLKCIRSSCRK